MDRKYITERDTEQGRSTFPLVSTLPARLQVFAAQMRSQGAAVLHHTEGLFIVARQ